MLKIKTANSFENCWIDGGEEKGGDVKGGAEKGGEEKGGEEKGPDQFIVSECIVTLS